MIPEGMITELVKYGGDLFTEAGILAHKRDLILSSPLVITRDGEAAIITAEDAVAKAISLEHSGVGRISLISGWRNNGPLIPFYDCIEGVRKNTKLDISVNFGVLDKAHMVILKEIGVNSVSCALPVAGFREFQEIDLEDGYKARMKTLRDAKELGLKTCINLVIGLNESLDDIDSSLRVVEQLGVEFLSIVSIWPMMSSETRDGYRLINIAQITAIARLCLSDDTDIGIACDGATEYTWGMGCGANVFTLALPNPKANHGLLCTEVSRLKNMWRACPELKGARLSSFRGQFN
jgi:uncharacterized radical SAM superfamily protein